MFSLPFLFLNFVYNITFSYFLEICAVFQNNIDTSTGQRGRETSAKEASLVCLFLFSPCTHLESYGLHSEQQPSWKLTAII